MYYIIKVVRLSWLWGVFAGIALITGILFSALTKDSSYILIGVAGFCLLFTIAILGMALDPPLRKTDKQKAARLLELLQIKPENMTADEKDSFDQLISELGHVPLSAFRKK